MAEARLESTPAANDWYFRSPDGETLEDLTGAGERQMARRTRPGAIA